MNRPIKFRGWHKTLKKMLYPPHLLDSMTQCRGSDGEHIFFQKHELMNSGEFKYITYPFEAYMDWNGGCYQDGYYQDIEWMQFTGIKDINDKEIYEGDILKTPPVFGYTVEEYRSKNLYVVWSVKLCQFLLNENESDVSNREIHTLADCCEIIGNIFENPELLKEM